MASWSMYASILPISFYGSQAGPGEASSRRSVRSIELTDFEKSCKAGSNGRQSARSVPAASRP